MLGVMLLNIPKDCSDFLRAAFKLILRFGEFVLRLGFQRGDTRTHRSRRFHVAATYARHHGDVVTLQFSDTFIAVGWIVLCIAVVVVAGRYLLNPFLSLLASTGARARPERRWRRAGVGEPAARR
jgi:hypothetical protein